ncbi:hypothetical protein D9619_013053 [Psilocybe cf. subviscida]|uniref:Uncharacterized protein n=1 Tax=Psilocybe cf. subviscida TaxID=2480587 RepID=A0A8H5B154_9AGAR|nr:hypothetical protein D9619_013053 [Psilocybe cf. subviscida]
MAAVTNIPWELIYPPQYIQSINDSGFNRILVESFLIGLYNLLYAKAIYRLFKRKNNTFHISMQTSLWVIINLSYATDWEVLRVAFVKHNSSAFDMEQEITGFTNDITAPTVLRQIWTVSAALIADTLLAWRCIIVWQKNRWILCGLVLLLTTNLVLGIFSSLPTGAFPRSTSDNPLIAYSAALLRVTLFAVFYVICLATTIVATSLILLKIWITSRRIHSPFSYRKLGAILAESGILYSAVLLGQATLAAIKWTYTPVNGFKYAARLNTATDVIVCLTMPVTGIAPALIALRVGRETNPTDTDGSTPGSHLTFQRTQQSTVQFGSHHGRTLHDTISTQLSVYEHEDNGISDMTAKESV